MRFEFLWLSAMVALGGCHGESEHPPTGLTQPTSAAFVMLASTESDRILAEALEREVVRLAGSPAALTIRTSTSLAGGDGGSPAARVEACGANRSCLGGLAADWDVDELVVGRLVSRGAELVLQYLTLRRGDGAIIGRVQKTVARRAELEASLAESFEAVLGVAPKAEPSAVDDAVSLGRVRSLVGEARIRRAATLVWEPMTSDTELFGGDVIETGDGEVEIAYASGATGKIAPKSLLVLEQAASPGAGGEQVALRSGSFSGQGAGLRVRTGASDPVVLESRGTDEPLEYRIGVRQGGALEVALRKGEGTLRSARGEAVALKAGEAQDVASGALKGKVEALPDFPRLVSPGIDATVERVEDLNVELSWAPVRGVPRYRLQIASDQSFARPLVEIDVAAPPYEFEPPAEGTFHWRVASLSTDGRQGEYGFTRRILVVAEQIPDLLVAPPEDATISFGGKAIRFVTFSWRAAVPPAPYRLIVTTDAELQEEPALSIVTTSQNVMTRQLEAGVYYWGVFVERGDKSKPIFRTARRLTLVD